MRTRTYDKITDNAKRLAQMHQFRAEPFLLLLGCLSGGGQKARVACANIQLQKFVHRELRISDDAVTGRALHFHPPFGRWAPVITPGLSRRLGDDVGERDEDEEGGEEEEDDAPKRNRTKKKRAPIVEDEDDEDEEDESFDHSTTGDAQEVPLPKIHSPYLNVMYGQLMLCAKAYQSAMCA